VTVVCMLDLCGRNLPAAVAPNPSLLGVSAAPQNRANSCVLIGHETQVVAGLMAAPRNSYLQPPSSRGSRLLVCWPTGA